MSNAGRIRVSEIAERLGIGRLAVYRLLEQHVIPAIRLGRRWIVTTRAYEAWELACGREAVDVSTPQQAR